MNIAEFCLSLSHEVVQKMTLFFVLKFGEPFYLQDIWDLVRLFKDRKKEYAPYFLTVKDGVERSMIQSVVNNLYRVMETTTRARAGDDPLNWREAYNAAEAATQIFEWRV